MDARAWRRTMAAELTGTVLVDNHCHGLSARAPADLAEWRSWFTESPGRMPAAMVATQVAYHRMIQTLAGFFGSLPEEDAVLAARAELSPAALATRLFDDAGLDVLLVDTGFPADADDLLPLDRMAGDVRTVHRVLRLETTFEALVAAHDSIDDVVAAVRAQLAGAGAAGYVAAKSIAAYRGGLAIGRWPADEVRGAFRAARADVGRTGRVRLGHRPLLDTLLHVALDESAGRGLPVQFHVGFGDTDLDLPRAAPTLLRPVLEDPAYRDLRLVLLHGCWPYVREGGYLAAVYPQVHLDLSYGIPLLSRAEQAAMTRAAVGAAPLGKLLYSSDGVRAPELHWLSAHDARAALATVLAELVEADDLRPEEAAAAGRAVLRDNAIELYGLQRAARTTQ